MMFRSAPVVLFCGRIYSRSFNSQLSNRYFHVGGCVYSANAVPEKDSSKEALLQLRKRTGYSISKCKQAIIKFGNDLTQAELWLQENARKEGWEKIGKRTNVATAQGLLGMIVANGLAAIVEVNCQTDFVARNEKFRSLVAQISRGIFNDAARNYRLNQDEITSKWNLSFERVSEKGLDFGETLPDLLASSVGHIGEKINVAGAQVMRVAGDISLAGYVHPRVEENIIDGVPTGHFAALVALRIGQNTPAAIRGKLGYQLCQHIVGMNPSGIGEPPTSEESAAVDSSVSTPSPDSPQRQGQQDDDDDEDDRETALHAAQVTKLSNESTLLRQDFMLEPCVTVHEFLVQNDATVIDFVRLERGAISAVHCSDK